MEEGVKNKTQKMNMDDRLILKIILEAEEQSYSLDPASHRRPKEEKEKKYRLVLQKRIADYIKNGSEGNLDLIGSPITKLPENLKVKGSLILINTPITELPDGLEVGEDLDLWRSEITKLPNNLKVGKWLILSDTPIKNLSSCLSVGGVLYLDRTSVSEIPKDIKVRGDVRLFNTPIAKEYTKEQIKQMCPGIKGNILM